MKIRLHQLAKELRVKVEDITSDMEVRSSPVLVGAGLGLVQLVNLWVPFDVPLVVCSRAEISCARLFD